MSHFNKKENPYIVDVSKKKITKRTAIAKGEVKFDTNSFKEIQSFRTKKGNIEKTAIIAGILSAKETSKLIPLCHNIPINYIDIDIKKNIKDCLLIVECTVNTNSNTGVEMEALTAVSISCLTIYDMCKYLNKKIEIQNIKLIKKTGGKSNI